LSNPSGEATFRLPFLSPHANDMPSDIPPANQTSASPPDSEMISEAERSTSARIGAVLFKYRGWLPVPFLFIPLVVHGTSDAMSWIVGFVLIALGEAIRLAGVAAAGTVTRRRSRTVQRLVTYGIFAWTRNPLYVGNFLIWMGFTVISGVLWFLPIAIVLFAVEYTLIVRYEEGVLETIFGSEYLAYKARTSRWFPRPPGNDEEGEHNWGEAWRSEISTFLQYAVLTGAFALKQRYGW
jgi:protein-S-isoprenylcysteine O-methyltransferase Ste14